MKAVLFTHSMLNKMALTKLSHIYYCHGVIVVYNFIPQKF